MALTGFDMSLLQQKYAAMTKQADADMKRADAAMLSASRSGLDGGGAMDPNAGLQAQLIQAQIKQAIAATNATNVQASNAEDANLMSKKLFDRTYNFDGPTRDQLQADAEADAQLELEVVRENSRAIALYQAVGFAEYGRNPRGFRSRSAGWQELVLMRKELD